MPTFAELWEQPEPAAPPPQPSRFAKPVAEPTTASFANLWESVPEVPERKVGGFGDYVKGLGRSTASLADVVLGDVPSAIAGQVVYPFARLVQTPEQAVSTTEKIAGKLKSPVGNIFGVTETPEYKGEASRQLTEFIGQNIAKGADWISANTGIPKADVENMIGNLTMGAPELARMGRQAGIATYEAGKQVVQPVVSAAKQEAKLITGTPSIESKRAEMGYGTQSGQKSYGSVGAASADDYIVRQGNIDAAIANASPTVQQYVGSLTPDNVNIPALQIKSLEEKHGVQLTTGQRTGDTARYSREWNERGGEGNRLGERFGSQPAELAGAVDNARIKNAPDINDIDPSNLGQLQINGLAAKDQMRLKAINEAYGDLTAANGGQFPIDIGALQTNIKNGLSKELKTSHISDAILKDLQEFYGDPTFEKYEALRTNLANEMRSSSNGNARAAAWIVRNELEKLPVFGEGTGSPQAIQLKQLADKARSLVKERSDVIRTNPAYKAAVKEFADASEAMSQGESLNAAKFHQKYVSNATPESIRRMKAELLPDDIANQAITAGEFERLKNNLINVNENNVKSEMFASFLKKNASTLKETLGPEGFKDAVEIGLLSSKIAKPAAGTFNYSNTWSAMLGDLVKEGIVSGLEANLALSTKGASIPVIGGVKQLAERVSKNRFAGSSLDPLGGIALKDIGNKKPTTTTTGAVRKTYEPNSQVNIRDIVKD